MGFGPSEMGMVASLAPRVDESEARREMDKFEREYGTLEVGVEIDERDLQDAWADIDVPDPGPSRRDRLRGAAGTAGRVGKSVGKFGGQVAAAKALQKLGLPVTVPTTELPDLLGQGDPDDLAEGSGDGDSPAGGAIGTSASEPGDLLGVAESQLAVQEEILDILEDFHRDASLDGGRSRLRGRGGLGGAVGGAANAVGGMGVMGALLAVGAVGSVLDTLEDFQWPAIPNPDWTPIEIPEPGWLPIEVPTPETETTETTETTDPTPSPRPVLRSEGVYDPPSDPSGDEWEMPDVDPETVLGGLLTGTGIYALTRHLQGGGLPRVGGVPGNFGGIIAGEMSRSQQKPEDERNLYERIMAGLLPDGQQATALSMNPLVNVPTGAQDGAQPGLAGGDARMGTIASQNRAAEQRRAQAGQTDVNISIDTSIDASSLREIKREIQRAADEAKRDFEREVRGRSSAGTGSSGGSGGAMMR